jgi:hypothetical protein
MHTHRITANYPKFPEEDRASFATIHDDMLEQVAAFFGTSEFEMHINTTDAETSNWIIVEATASLDEEDEVYEAPLSRPNVSNPVIGGRQIFP